MNDERIEGGRWRLGWRSLLGPRLLWGCCGGGAAWSANCTRLPGGPGCAPTPMANRSKLRRWSIVHGCKTVAQRDKCKSVVKIATELWFFVRRHVVLSCRGKG